MNMVSMKQAHMWAHKIMTDTTNLRKDSGENFDAMLYVESKDVRAILPVIVNSLNQRHDAEFDGAGKQDYSSALTCLLKTMRQTYGEADNPILSNVREIGHEDLQGNFDKLNEFANRVAAEAQEQKNDLSMKQMVSEP